VHCASLCVLTLLADAPAALGAATTGATGGDQPFSTHQPTLGLQFAVHERGSVGEIRMFAFSNLPFSWLRADGQQLSNAGGNAALATELGNAYGGDANFFNLPNLVDRLPVGVGQGFGLTNRARGDQFGVEDITLTEDQMPTHAHGSSGGGVTGDAGGGQAHSTVQPSLGLRFGVQNFNGGSFPDRNNPDPVAGTPAKPFVGQIRLMAGSTTLPNVEAADGHTLSIAQNTALFSLFGTTYGGNGQTTYGMPDLRGRTPIGQGQGPGLSNRDLGEQPGNETITLDTAQMPSHTHTEPGGNTDPTGGSQTIDNMQPSLGINYLIRLQGASVGTQSAYDPAAAYIGEVIMFGGNFAPAGWAMCEGQLMVIAQNQALFNAMGNAFGGDGITTFALPDLRGRGLNGVPGYQPGRSILGDERGTESITLGVNNLPSHVHEIPAPTPIGVLAFASGAGLSRRRRA